jgi:hypothetical protein
MATGSIRERNGRFYVRTRVLTVDRETGRSRWQQVEKAAGSTRRDAQAALRALQGEVAEGRFLPSSLTVAELGHKWLSEHVQPNLKPGAAANYEGTFYRHVVPVLGALRLDDCTPPRIKALLGKKRAEGLSGETVAKIRRHMHAMFAFAQDEGLVSVNPANGPRARGRRLSGRGARGTELSPVQVKRFLSACSPRWRVFFTVALDTGLRRGELVGLCWGDVDLLQRIIYVRRSIGAYDKADLLGGEDSRRLTTKTGLVSGWCRFLMVPRPRSRSSTSAQLIPAIIRRCSRRLRQDAGAMGRGGRPDSPSPRAWSRGSFAVMQSAPRCHQASACTISGTRRSRTQSVRGRTSC